MTSASRHNDAGVMQRTVAANGLDFPVLEIGKGPLVLCLHGFPDHPRSWIPIMNRLAGQGYRAVAPTMRGYWPEGAAPDGRYDMVTLGQDVLALIEALGEEKAYLVGHDIGARCAYSAAGIDPSRVEKLVGLAVPYGQKLLTAFVADGDQQRRSWYMFYFQTQLAEMAVPFNDFAFIDRLWAEWSPGYELPDQERSSLKAALGQPGVLTGAFGFYRQLINPLPADAAHKALEEKTLGPIMVPSLYLHGAQDGCIASYLAEGIEELFPNGLQNEVMQGVGHFLQLEEPDMVAERILRFFAT